MTFISRAILSNLRSTRSRINPMATFSTDNLKVVHDEKKHEFTVSLDGAKAVLNYDKTGPRLVDLYHTEVPPSFLGKGVAKILAKSAFDFVVKEDLKMRVSCTYLQKYLKDHPQENYLKRVVE